MRFSSYIAIHNYLSHVEIVQASPTLASLMLYIVAAQAKCKYKSQIGVMHELEAGDKICVSGLDVFRMTVLELPVTLVQLYEYNIESKEFYKKETPNQKDIAKTTLQRRAEKIRQLNESLRKKNSSNT